MDAHVGDRIHVHGRSVGHAEHSAEIIKIRNRPNEPPMFTVRYDDGRETLVCPGPDAVLEHGADCQST